MEYPCYKIHEHSGRILELTSSRKGTIVYDKTDYYKKGTFNGDWAEHVCRPLTNEEYFDFIISPLNEGDEFVYGGSEHKISKKIVESNSITIKGTFTRGVFNYFLERFNCSKIQILNIKKGKENMKEFTEYKSIKEITGKEIILNDACENAAKKFIEHFGIKTVVQWSKDNEDYIVMQDGWISWLLKKGFIEANKIEYDTSKVYTITIKDKSYINVALLTKISSEKYVWSSIGESIGKVGFWSNSIFDSVSHAVESYDNNNHYSVGIFNTFEEAIKFYFPDMNKSEELTDDMSKLKKMKEWMNKFDFSVDCHDFDGCNADVDCVYCPFQTK